jgi:uncharacterized membrane protein YphA (DoxX/SURF4 family)
MSAHMTRAFNGSRPGGRIRIVLWLFQALLAVAFFAHGWMMLFPPASIVEQMNASLPRWFQLFIGAAEVAAATGLILPGLTGILPQLVPASAAGLMIVMIAATAFHLWRGEIGSAATTLLLLAMASFVAYMRWRVHPIRGRTVA